jgi:hypothetical protein
LLSLSAAALLVPAPGQAAVSAKDVEVAARVLNFTATPYAGRVRFGIVYDPNDADSTADERAILAIMGTGLSVGSIELVPVPVPIARLRTVPADVLFLTTGLDGGGAAAVGNRAAAAKTLCITTDLAATQAGECAVSVQSDPRVEITINAAAASASGISFGSAFLMMVTEI